MGGRRRKEKREREREKKREKEEVSVLLFFGEKNDGNLEKKKLEKKSFSLPVSFPAPLRMSTPIALDRAREVLRVVGDGLALEVDRPQLDAERREVRRVLHLAHAARGGEQGLGGDAAAVDAGASDVVALDDGNLEAACVWGEGERKGD